MAADVVHQIADGAGLRVAHQPLVVGPDKVACSVLRKAHHRGGQGKPHLIAKRLGCGCVVDDGAVWQVHIEMLVRLVVACLQFDQ